MYNLELREFGLALMLLKELSLFSGVSYCIVEIR